MPAEIIIKICQRGFSQAWPARLICNISDVMEYEPDADMIFNYLMVSALAAATDYVEKEGLKPSGGEKLLILILTRKTSRLLSSCLSLMLLCCKLCFHSHRVLI